MEVSRCRSGKNSGSVSGRAFNEFLTGVHYGCPTALRGGYIMEEPVGSSGKNSGSVPGVSQKR